MTYDTNSDAYQSWVFGIATLREINIRAGSVKPRPDDPEEQKWAREGKRPTNQLDTVKRP